MKFLLLFALVFPPVVACSDQAPPVFKREMPLDAGSFRGKTTLTLNKTKLKAGEKFTADVRFLNTSGGDKFYNPYFNALRPLPAKLAIFDSEKKYIGNLIDPNGGSRVSFETDSDWIYIASLAYVGKEISLFAGNTHGTMYDPMVGGKSWKKSLPNGRYYLQVIYNRSFIEHGFRGYNTELFRSNVVEIEIIEK